MSLSPAGLPLPQALLDLVESGFWPRTQQESNAQHSKPLISREKIRSFSPEEEYIFFYRPPFSTLEEWTRNNADLDWDDPIWAIHEVDPALMLLFGDFGLGSDAPLALDYRESLSVPSVICFQYHSGTGNHWVEIAPSFAEFAQILFD